MSNIDKQASQVQRFANYGVDMMEWADGGYVKHSDYQALLDELEAKDNRINRLEAIVAVAEQRNALMREWKRALKVPCDLVDDQVPVVIHGMVIRLERIKETEAKLEAAEKRIAELEAKAVSLRDERSGSGGICKQAGFNELPHGTPLHTVHTEPVSVPDNSAITKHFDTIALDTAREIMCDVNRRHEFLGGEVQLLSRIQCRIDDDCSAAMLQGAEPVTTAYKLPMQPLVIDAHGTLRFKENPIVRKLLDYATEHGYGLNEIALDEFEAEDQMQLAQLIGYSLSGYGTLSYVTDESYDRAAAAAPQQEVK